MKELIKSSIKTAQKNMPEILMVCGSVGVLTTIATTIKATPKALSQIDETMTNKEILKNSWKCYIPTMVSGAATLACFWGAYRIQSNRFSILAAAYVLTEKEFKNYIEKTKEVIGEKKERTIKEKIVKEKMEKADLEGIPMEGSDGTILCFDEYSGRYFRSTIENIKKAANNINSELLIDGHRSVNDFYDEIDCKELPSIPLGDYTGFLDSMPLDLRIDSMITKKNEPCIVISYEPILISASGYPME